MTINTHLRRILSVMLLFLLTLTGFAQQHLSYLGVALGGNKEESYRAWKKKGVVIDNNGRFNGKYKGMPYTFQINEDLSKLIITFETDKNGNDCMDFLMEFYNDRIHHVSGMDYIANLSLLMPFDGEEYELYYQPCLHYMNIVENAKGQFMGELSMKVIYPYDGNSKYVANSKNVVQYIFYDSSYQKNDPKFPYLLNTKWYDITPWTTFCQKAELSYYYDGEIALYRLKGTYKDSNNTLVDFDIAAGEDDKKFLDQLFSPKVMSSISKELFSQYLLFIIKNTGRERICWVCKNSFPPVLDAYVKKINEQVVQREKRKRIILEGLLGKFFSKSELDLLDKTFSADDLKRIFSGSGSSNSNDFMKQAEFATRKELNM